MHFGMSELHNFNKENPGAQFIKQQEYFYIAGACSL
jgi:hypothetical protein